MRANNTQTLTTVFLPAVTQWAMEVSAMVVGGVRYRGREVLRTRAAVMWGGGEECINVHWCHLLAPSWLCCGGAAYMDLLGQAERWVILCTDVSF